MNRAERRDEKKRQRRVAGVRKDWERQKRQEAGTAYCRSLDGTKVLRVEEKGAQR